VRVLITGITGFVGSHLAEYILENHMEVEDDPQRRQTLLDLAKTQLDWKPSTKLNEGLIRTIDYFRTIIKPYEQAALTFRNVVKKATSEKEGVMSELRCLEGQNLLDIQPGSYVQNGQRNLSL